MGTIRNPDGPEPMSKTAIAWVLFGAAIFSFVLVSVGIAFAITLLTAIFLPLALGCFIASVVIAASQVDW